VCAMPDNPSRDAICYSILSNWGSQNLNFKFPWSNGGELEKESSNFLAPARHLGLCQSGRGGVLTVYSKTKAAFLALFI
jgi:hypothetical protein